MLKFKRKFRHQRVKIEWEYSNLRKHTETMANVSSIRMNCKTSASVSCSVEADTCHIYISHIKVVHCLGHTKQMPSSRCSIRKFSIPSQLKSKYSCKYILLYECNSRCWSAVVVRRCKSNVWSNYITKLLISRVKLLVIGGQFISMN